VGDGGLERKLPRLLLLNPPPPCIADRLAGIATIQVPVITTGVLPAISFSPQFLADALVIGSTLRLSDGINPGLVTDPSGNYCVLMPCRCVAEAVTEEAAGKSPEQAMAA
jgi:hypothetical protein